MTQYKELIEKARENLEEEERLKDGKYLHLNNSIIEIKQLNGDIHYRDLKRNKKWTVFN